MHRLGEAIQCDLKALRMSKVDHAMSGYAALTRPTGLGRERKEGREHLLTRANRLIELGEGFGGQFEGNQVLRHGMTPDRLIEKAPKAGRSIRPRLGAVQDIT